MLSDAAVHKLKAITIQIGLEFLFYGVHLTLFLIAISCIAHRFGNSWVVPVVTVVIFLTVSVWSFADLHFYVISQRALQFNPFVIADLVGTYKRINTLEVAMVRINFVLSDFVVVWRAWIVWTGNRYVQATLGICLVATVACSVADFVISYRAIETLNIYGPAEARALLAILPLLITNVVASALVGYKVWDYRRTIKASLGQRSRTRVEKVMMLLVESGLLYAVIWIVFLAFSVTNIEAFTSLGPVFIAWRASLSFAGIYSTIVITIVSTSRSPSMAIGTGGSLSSAPVSQPIKLRTFSTSAGSSSAGAYSSAGTQSGSYDTDASRSSRAGPSRSDLYTASSTTLRTPRYSEDMPRVQHDEEEDDIAWHTRSTPSKYREDIADDL
ncbi:hypothetical protein BD626DRAFT_392096 [Schizophyllum amplum]|uniref:Uncharacterized protein n=1 Tax=Schizophyllum amplum TaxID=97359 RepID=A0A550CY88_9AGAR|nr:hypothetical protein BD626DRAFT_392096 [Auriculariopsis ampla]